MRYVRDVLRLYFECKMGKRPMAKSLGLSRNTIRLLARAEKAGVSWPVAPPLTDAALENLPFPVLPREAPKRLPNWKVVHQELQNHKRLNLTRNPLWIEYGAQHPTGY